MRFPAAALGCCPRAGVESRAGLEAGAGAGPRAGTCPPPTAAGRPPPRGSPPRPLSCAKAATQIRTDTPIIFFTSTSLAKSRPLNLLHAMRQLKPADLFGCERGFLPATGLPRYFATGSNFRCVRPVWLRLCQVRCGNSRFGPGRTWPRRRPMSVTPRIWLAIRVSVNRLDGHFRHAETDCQPRPDRIRWTRQSERDAVCHLPRITSGEPGDGQLRGEIGLFGDLEAAGRFRRLPEFQRNAFHRCNQRAIQTDRPRRRPARDHEENIRHVLGGGSPE